MTTETSNTVAGRTIAQKTGKALEESLSAFAHRFPISGRIVHAIAGEVGGVLALADRFEEQGLWPEVEGWMATGKPTTLSPGSIHTVFGSSLIERTAAHLGIPRESVEIQLALGIPKFFAALSADGDLGLGYGAKKKSRMKDRQTRKTDQKRSMIPPP